MQSLLLQKAGVLLLFVLPAVLFAAPSVRLVARAYERTVTRKAAKIARTYAVLTSITLAALELAAMHFHAAVDATYLEKLFTVFLLSLFGF